MIESTPWVSSCLMVVNKVGSCIDPKDLKKALNCNYYALPTFDEVIPQLTKAKVFSILDDKMDSGTSNLIMKGR